MARSIVGARVLELGGYLAAPFGSLLLANLGAEIIKIEGPRGDETRHLPIAKTFMATNAGKRSIALDVKQPDGYEVFTRLLKTADVVLHNVSERATEQLRITYEDCRRVKPDVVYAQITGFGDGPYAGRAATNPLIEALVGTSAWGDGKPTRLGGAYYDQMAGALAALGAVAALGSDSVDPSVRRIKIGLFEVGLYLDGPRLLPRTNEVKGVSRASAFVSPSYDTFRAADGWVYVGAASDPLWTKLCHALDLDDLAADPTLATRRQREERRTDIVRVLERTIAALPADTVIDRLIAAGVPCVPVREHDDVFRDVHVQSDGKLTETSCDGAQFDLGSFPLVGAGVTPSAAATAPTLGQHSVEILRSLGFDDAACTELLDRAVVWTS